MRQLSGADSMFLQFERGNNFMHVASLAIYDPSTAPGGGVRFKDVLRHFATRIAQFPQFRRRLVSLPLSLDRPYWVESDSIDVEFHVRHIAVPHPGDWRQLCIQVARLHSRPLDRSKPLWEAYVIEGLHNVPGVPPGSFALYTKMHHSIVDGESGTEIMRALHSLTPESIDFDAEERSASGIYHADREPTLVELYSRALAHNVQKLPNIARFSLGTARKVASLGAEALTKFNNLGRGRLRCQRAFAADGRPEHAAAAHAAADPIQPRRFRTPRVRSRLAAARRFPCDPSAGAESHHQRPVPLHRRRRAARLPVREERTARYVDGRHGADDAARPGKGRRRRQPGRLHADARALRDRGSARTPAHDLRRGRDRPSA